jgi:hypothetical protein
MARQLKIIGTIAGCLFSIGCFLSINSLALADISSDNSSLGKSPIITLTGTIEKAEVEKGCYRLVASDGKNYELSGKFPKRNHLRVRLRGEVVRDTATICQIGELIKVKSFRIIRNSSSSGQAK